MTRRIVVVGGGVTGCSVAWHAAARGLGEVTLLERERLGAGTTWHSAGNVTWRPSGDSDAPVRYMLETIARLERETGQATGWLETGRLFLARGEAALERFRAMADEAACRGHPSRVLGPAEAADRHPLLAAEAIVGAWLNGLSGRLNPADLTAAYAAAARGAGARILEGCRVEALEVEHDRVSAVRTSGGRIPADAVAVCAGLWSRDLLAPLGVPLAHWACQHFYVIADVAPRLARTTPSFVCPEDLTYGREEVGGFLWGCFDEAALTLEPDALPDPFAFTLLDPIWDKLAPYFEQAAEVFPALRDAPIRQFVNGPECFTPDGHPLVGAVPGIEGLLVASGMSSHGVTLSAAAGHNLADLIADEPPRFAADHHRPDRFGSQAEDAGWVRAEASATPSRYYRGSNL